MLHRSDVIPLLLAACPCCRAAWDAHRTSWSNEDAGAFNDVLIIACHAVDGIANGHTACLPALFATIEQLLIDGDEQTQALASVGLLEDLSVVASHEPFGSDVFVPWLEPRSRAAWERTRAVWTGHRTLADVIRAERHHTSPTNAPPDGRPSN